MNAPLKPEALASVAFELDGRPVEAFEGETILKAAERHGVEIPRLCYTDGLRADGNAAPAWSRSRASACWRPAAAARCSRA